MSKRKGTKVVNDMVEKVEIRDEEMNFHYNGKNAR